MANDNHFIIVTYYNVNKYHRFLHGDIKKFEGKTEQMAA